MSLPSLEEPEPGTVRNYRCIEWRGKRHYRGYGILPGVRGPRKPCVGHPNGRPAHRHESGHKYAHRWAYEKFYGPIRSAMEVMHRCDNPSCINPLHLALGTHRDNMRDAANKLRWAYQRRTACPSGHQYETNRVRRPNGHHYCRECSRVRSLKYQRRLRGYHGKENA